MSRAGSWKDLKHECLALIPYMFLPCSKLVQWRQSRSWLSEGVERAQGGVHAESPPHMNTAAPLINYHHNTHRGTNWNVASHCHSYILLLLSNVMPTLGSLSLQLAAMVPASPVVSRDSLACGTRGLHPSHNFCISISKKGNSTYSCPKRCLHQGRRKGAQGTSAEVSVAPCAAAAQDSYGVRADKPTPSSLWPALTLTADPAAQAPLLLGNTLNSNTRPLQFAAQKSAACKSYFIICGNSYNDYECVLSFRFSPYRHPQEVLY